MTWLGSGLFIAGMSWAVYRILRNSRMLLNNSSTSQLNTEEAKTPRNPNLTANEMIALIQELMTNFPTCLSNLRQDFRNRRRELTHNSDTYRDYIDQFLIRYPANESLVRQNLVQVLDRHHISKSHFYDLVKQYETNPDVKQALARIDYDTDFDFREECPPGIKEVKLIEILNQKLVLLKATEKAKCTNDFLKAEILIADDSHERFGFEEEQVVAANVKYQSQTLLRIKEQIFEETRRITRIELIPDFSFA